MEGNKEYKIFMANEINLLSIAFLFLETLMKRVELKYKCLATCLKLKKIAIKLFNTAAPGIPLFLNVTNIASNTYGSDILTSHWEWRRQADSEKEAEIEVKYAKAVSNIITNPSSEEASAIQRLNAEIGRRYALITTRSKSLTSPNPVSMTRLNETFSVLQLRKAAWDILSFQKDLQLPTPLVLGSSRFMSLCPNFATSSWHLYLGVTHYRGILQFLLAYVQEVQGGSAQRRSG